MTTDTERDKSRVLEVIDDNPDIIVQITDAGRSTESHGQLQSFIVYTITLGSLMVKRRYSEFESLRQCFVKCYPTKIIPPIPEKQSLKANLSEIGTGGRRGSASSAVEEPASVSSLIAYRKRMLALFLNRCLQDATLKRSCFLLSFFDPEVNFYDYLGEGSNATLCHASIYQLSAQSPLGNLTNQIYLTLPLPTDTGQFPELASTPEFQRLVSYENKFDKYETVLDRISCTNKRLLKNLDDLSPEMSELGSQYNTLSQLEDSTEIEQVGRSFDRRLIALGQLSQSLNVDFLDRLVELKHFARAVKELTGYNRKKMVQDKLVEKQLTQTRLKYKSAELQQAEIERIDQKAQHAMGKQVAPTHETQITDEELQTYLYDESNKPAYGRIPGIKRISSAIQKYRDPDPDQTRRQKLHALKMRAYQLVRQHELLGQDTKYVNREAYKELVEFHEWFAGQLGEMVANYNGALVSYVSDSQGGAL